jgi:hypothetical protein
MKKTPGGQGQEHLSPWLLLTTGPAELLSSGRVGGGGPIRGSQPPLSVGFAKTQSHALRRQASASIADKLVNQLAMSVGDLVANSHFLK